MKTPKHTPCCLPAHHHQRSRIESGGTFTDVYAELPDGSTRVLKLLTVDPRHYDSAPLEAIRRVLSDATGVQHSRGAPLPTDRIESIRMGTTVATNALLERKGARIALLVTAGFRDLQFAQTLTTHPLCSNRAEEQPVEPCADCSALSLPAACVRHGASS